MSDRPRVKICCIASIDEARMAIDAGASAIGLVSAMPSGPGPIDEVLIGDIARQAPPTVGTVLLTCRQQADEIIDQLHRTACNTVQLCDEVESSVYDAIRKLLPAVRIVQVIHVQDENSLEEARRAAPHVHALLLDSGRPRAEVKDLGGTGRVHDWQISRGIRDRVDVPVFLAGGLKPDNVRHAVDTVEPFGVDLCSGVRTEGRLDREKLHAFMRAVTS
jgi:phosphoribosylanthranilate isomerase